MVECCAGVSAGPNLLMRDNVNIRVWPSKTFIATPEILLWNNKPSCFTFLTEYILFDKGMSVGKHVVMRTNIAAPEYFKNLKLTQFD